MKSRKTKKLSLTLKKQVGSLHIAAAGLGLLCSVGAQAQQAASDGVLETIVVTAQKRSERIQDVPIAVTAITGDALEKMGASRWEDLPLPAIKVGPGGLTDSMYIRGIGSGTNPSFEQSAPVFVDGMWYSSSRASRVGFLDIERIEVLKGPQPTYFGKNAISGAMSLVTRKPRMKKEAYVDAMYEFENQETVLTAAMTTPMSDTLSMRFAGKARALDKGWEQNLATGTQDPRYKDHAGRVSLYWAPTDNFSLDVKFESGKQQEEGRSTELTACTPSALANPGLLNPAIANCTIDFKRAVSFNAANYGVLGTLVDLNRPAERSSNQVDGVQIAAQWEANGYNLTANLNSYKNNYKAEGKQDHTSLMRGLAGGTEQTDNTSLEVRLDSPRKQRLFWTAGIYSDSGNGDLFAYSFTLLPNANGGPTGVALGQAASRSGGTLSDMVQKSSSWSAFGEAGFALTDSLTAKVAVRDTTQKKSLDGYQTQYNLTGGTAVTVSPSGLGGLVPAVGPTIATRSADPLVTFTGNQAIKNTSTDPAVTFEWRPSGRQMFYASARKGFKAGGLDLFNKPFGSMEYKPETVNYTEAGAKLEFMNGALRLNTALFRSDYKNLQSAVVDPVTGNTTTSNAGGARSQGLELEVAWAMNQQWRLGGSLNYLDSRYTEFKGQPCWSNPRQTLAEGCAANGLQDMTGRDTQFAPKWSGSATARYVRPGDYFGIPSVLSVQMNLTYTDSFITFGNADPNTRHPSYSLVDLRFGLAEKKNKWDVGFLIRNLFDETTMGWIANLPVSGAFNGGHFAVVNRPRQFALQGRYNF